MPVTQSSTGGTTFQTFSAKRQIKMPRSLYDYRGSNFFDPTYIAADANGNKYVWEGLIVALAAVADDATYGATYKFVPYESGGSYGVNSDVPYGILDIRLNATLDGEAIAVIYHGQLQEQNIYVYGGALGTVPAAVKTALPDIDWVPAPA